MADLTSINAQQPAGNETPTLGDDRIRALEAAILGFALLEHDLNGRHLFPHGPLASRPAYGNDGRIYILETAGLLPELQYDNGTSWVTITSLNNIAAVLYGLAAHIASNPATHAPGSINSSLIAVGNILKKHLDGGSDNVVISALVDGASADALHSHAQYIPFGTGIDISSLGPLVAGPIVLAQSLVPKDIPYSTPVKLKEIHLNHKGTVTVKFELLNDVTTGNDGMVQIYKNGGAFGTQHNFTSPDDTDDVFTEDLTFNAGDNIQIWGNMTTNNAGPTTVSNFIVSAAWDAVVTLD
jgi:hypothetical protein